MRIIILAFHLAVIISSGCIIDVNSLYYASAFSSSSIQHVASRNLYRPSIIRLAAASANNNNDDLEKMRVSQIKAELNRLLVNFSDCFDKESLVEKLVRAREDPVPPNATNHGESEEIEPARMKLSEIKAELKQRRIDFSDCFDKEGIVEKLVQARNGLIDPMPEPTSQSTTTQQSSNNFDFGAETQADDTSSMDDAFKAAGWTGVGSDPPKPVDEARTPGMSRNFDNIDTDDFKKSFSPGQNRRR
eukprot:CAMPEP_0194140184 /NCGR_PEP_ID=MMETSP0152-20130528/9762_1 /TAXON_ID=1049557 /ORGANISM="Thalassiothrix antarctica, Strain L6-D1" /LENGTH=245 /DNA_ID=CAMNT_0038838331 /DNA_START=58 /DNA_END=795 /DNA_ORIENTATION=+